MNDFQLGVKAHQTGQLQQAKHHYLQHLSTAKNDANAQQLLGLVYSAMGDLDNAISWMQQSLAIQSEQPHVLNNLGLCQKNKGLYPEAIASFNAAIKQQKDYLDPHRNLIRLLLDLGCLPDAESAIKKAMTVFPSDVSIAKLNASYFQVAENYSKAIELYKQLLTSQPNSAPIKHSLAINLRLNGQADRALELYEELERAGVSQFQLFHNKANALADLGQLQPAIEYYRKAIELNPSYVDSHVNLNELLWEIGDNSAFLRSYNDAFSRGATAPELVFSYVSALLRTSQFQPSLDFLTQLPVEFHHHHHYFDLMGRAYKGLGRMSDAIDAQQQIITMADVPTDAVLNFAETLLEAADYPRAETVLDDLLHDDPDNVHGWALQGLVWEQTDDPRRTVLNDYEHLVREFDVQAPDGFHDIEQFCSQLNAYLSSLHTATRQPLEQTLSGGTQTRGNLFQDTHPLITALVDQFKGCISTYIEETRPYVGRLPIIKTSDAFKFSGSWSVRLSREGFHTQHIHPMGWLSSVFYVQLPSSVTQSSTTESNEGWFKLGEPNIQLPTPAKTKKLIQPAVGKLILFPSYMWHGTVPFDSDEFRTTIAFDVIEDPTTPEKS